MPAPELILNGLSDIANQWWLLAAAWHAYFAVLIGGLIFGVRPSKRVAGILLALPLLSVSVLAWTAANPFNGALLRLPGVALIALAFRLPDEPIRIAPLWVVAAAYVRLWVGVPALSGYVPPICVLGCGADGLSALPHLVDRDWAGADCRRARFTALDFRPGRHRSLLRPLWRHAAGCHHRHCAAARCVGCPSGRLYA